MDVRLYSTPNGGEINCVNGMLELGDGLETAVYLSLFGGNDHDSGLEGTKHLQWWGNLSEQDPNRRYRSETQYLLRSIPAVTGNIRRIQDAVTTDLAWMTETGLAKSISVSVSMPGVNQVSISIVAIINDQQFPLRFAAPWKVNQ